MGCAANWLVGPLALPSPPGRLGAVRGKSCGAEGSEIAPEFLLGRPCAVGVQPTDSIRGHPRLGAVEGRFDAEKFENPTDADID